MENYVHDVLYPLLRFILIVDIILACQKEKKMYMVNSRKEKCIDYNYVFFLNGVFRQNLMKLRVFKCFNEN